MVVDASAILAIHLDEPEREAFRERILQATGIMSPVNYWEALVRAQAFDGEAGRDKIVQLIDFLDIEIVAVDVETAELAAHAFARFGKRAPAKLNMGDCFAYALAKSRGAPLLYKGGDFAKTDIEAA
ncbi:MAG: hypothetical protein A4S17_13670 [Proteobacteria bacterium HN_bin10]|nr:MAG: hypothetical protein A4S17_13670 [Proteobacteria bacterium HN_bin10]